MTAKEIIINPTGHPDKKTEQQASRMAWAEIQSCADEEHNGKHRPNGEWKAVHPDDIPEWVREKGNMGRMMNGLACNKNAEEGGTWYRAVHCAPPGSGEGLVQ